VGMQTWTTPSVSAYADESATQRVRIEFIVLDTNVAVSNNESNGRVSMWL